MALCCTKPGQIEHTCKYEHGPGNVQAPLFHEVQIRELDVGVGLRTEGGCRDSSAHWYLVWSTPRHSVQN